MQKGFKLENLLLIVSFFLNELRLSLNPEIQRMKPKRKEFMFQKIRQSCLLAKEALYQSRLLAKEAPT